MLGDKARDHLLRREEGERTLLVVPDQAAKAGDIGGHDHGQPPTRPRRAGRGICFVGHRPTPRQLRGRAHGRILSRGYHSVVRAARGSRAHLYIGRAHHAAYTGVQLWRREAR